MHRRRLGSSLRDVAVIGLGGKGLTGARRGLSPDDVQRAVGAAIDAGCELIDVPAAGEPERRVGIELRALRARDRVIVATAVGGPGRKPPLAAQVQRGVEDALRGLRIDALPLVQLAGWDDAWLDDRTWPELRGTLARLISEGKARAWGVIAPDGTAPLRVIAEPWLASVQVRYSLFDRAVEEAVLPAALAAKVGVIAREPLAAGGLAGDLGPGTPWLPGDERATWPARRWRDLPEELARLAALVRSTPPAATASEAGRALLDGLIRGDDLEQATVAELALRFVVDHPAITVAIAGARTAAHVAANLGCADGRRLSARVRAALDERRWGEGWYATGPVAATIDR